MAVPSLRGRLRRRLEEYLANSAAELDELGEELRGREARLRAEQQEIESREAVIVARKRQLEQFEISEGDQQEEIRRLLELVSDREQSLAELSSKHEWASARMAASEARREQETAKREAEASRTSELEKTGERLRGEVERLHGELAETIDRRDSLALALERANEARATAEAGLQLEREYREQAEAGLRTAQERAASLGGEVTSAQALVESTRREADELRAALFEAKDTIMRLQREVDDARLVEATSEARSQERDRQLTDLMQERDELSRRLAELAGQREVIDVLGRTLETLRHGLAERDAAIDDLAERLAESRLELIKARESSARKHERGAPSPTENAPDADAGTPQTGARRQPRNTEGHLVVVPVGERYRILARSGPAPPPSAELDLSEYGGRRFRVAKVGPSPFPGDTRRYAQLEEIPGLSP